MPRPIGPTEYQAMRQAVETQYGKIKNAEAPSKSYVGVKAENVEDNEIVAEELTEVTSKSETEVDTDAGVDMSVLSLGEGDNPHRVTDELALCCGACGPHMADLRCCTCGSGGSHNAYLHPCDFIHECGHWLHLDCAWFCWPGPPPHQELVPVCGHHPPERLVMYSRVRRQLSKVARPAASASSCGAALEQRGGQ